METIGRVQGLGFQLHACLLTLLSRVSSDYHLHDATRLARKGQVWASAVVHLLCAFSVCLPMRRYFPTVAFFDYLSVFCQNILCRTSQP